MKELFSIGDAADFVGITRRIILNYEAHGLVFPDKKEDPSGNRYYTIDTLTKIRTIRSLQNLGLSLDEIHGYFDNSNDLLSMVRRLEALRDELNANIKALYERINQGFESMEIITIPPQTVYCRKTESDSIAEKDEFVKRGCLGSTAELWSGTYRADLFYRSSHYGCKGYVLFCCCPGRKQG